MTDDRQTDHATEKWVAIGEIACIHSVDRLTGDVSLRRPDLTITGHGPSSICSEPDVDLQLADHSRYVEDDLADASSPACHRVADLHGC